MALIFIKKGLKIKLFLPKKVFFRVLVDPTPTPYASGGWGSCPQTFGYGICNCAVRFWLRNPRLRFKLKKFWLRNLRLRLSLKNFGCGICACASTLKNFGCGICACALRSAF